MNQCLQTPDCLQRQFGIPAEAGRLRAVPRSPLAYDPPAPPRWASRPRELDRRRRPPRKREWLGALIPLIMSEALPGDGDQRHWKPKPVTQQTLAAMAGISRPAFTRTLSRFANVHGKRSLDTAYRPAFEFVQRERRFAIANSYSAGTDLPAGASRPRRDDAAAVSYPTVEDLCAHPRSGSLFAGGTRAGGYKLIPRWVWDPRLPVSRTARLLMTYYGMCGLLETGECHPKQATAAAAIGVSVRSVRRANAEWAAIGMIRVAHPDPIIHPDGRYERGAQIIVYLPLRTLDRETAAAEARRLIGARKRLQAQYAAFWDGILAVHGSLLHQWAGKEHRISAFHRAVREELTRLGVPRDAINALFPPQPSD